MALWPMPRPRINITAVAAPLHRSVYGAGKGDTMYLGIYGDVAMHARHLIEEHFLISVHL